MVEISTGELNAAQKAIDAIHRSGGLYTSEDVLRAALRAFVEYREGKAKKASQPRSYMASDIDFSKPIPGNAPLRNAIIKEFRAAFKGDQWTDEQLKQHKEEREGHMAKEQELEGHYATATDIEKRQKESEERLALVFQIGELRMQQGQDEQSMRRLERKCTRKDALLCEALTFIERCASNGNTAASLTQRIKLELGA
jgi:hypothetical protein